MNHTGQRVSIQTQNRMREVRKRFMEHVERKVDEEMVRIMIRVTDLVLPRIPVWTGETLANWRWSIDTVDNTLYQPEAQSLPPGPARTGQENRRDANEEKVRQSLRRAIQAPNKWKRTIFFTNPAPMAAPLEYEYTTPAGRDARGALRTAIAQVRNAGAR